MVGSGDADRVGVGRRSLSFVALLALVGLMMLPGVAGAEDRNLDVTVEKSLTYHGRRSPLPMPYHLRGASHGKVAESFGTMTTSQRTRALGRSAEHSCSIAFQSAIIRLQETARSRGGNGVVDIVSLVDGQEVEVPGGFRCRVGRVMVNVALVGRAVKLAD